MCKRGLSPIASLLARVEHQPDAGDDKWDTQKLSHIKSHALFKIYLYFLEEFYKETESEYSGYAESEIEPGTYPFFIMTVNKDHDNEDNEVGHRLV